MAKLLIKDPSDFIQVDGVIMLLYGQPGVRKTSWCFTAPNPLLFDFEGGIKRVAPQYRGKYSPIKTWEDLLDINPEDVAAFDTLVFDSASRAIDLCSEYVIRQNPKHKSGSGALSQQGWGALGVAFKTFTKRFRSYGKNIIFVAHDKEEKDGDVTMKRPDISGQSRALLTKDADFIGYMQVINKRSVACFTPSDTYYAKNSAMLAEHIHTDETTIADILSTYEDIVNSGNEDLPIYKAQLEDVRTKLDNVSTCEELNDVWPLIAEIPFVLDGKAMAGQMLRERVSELSCQLDKSTNKYVSKP